MKKRLPVNIDDLGLTPREIKFVCEYITNGYNAEEAAKTSGLLSRDAGSVASRLHCAQLLQNDKIKEAITRTRASFVEPYRDVHYAKIQEVLEVRAFYDTLTFFNPDGTARPLDQIPVKQRYAIDGVDEKWSMGKNGVNERTVTYTLANRDKARAELRALHEAKEEKKDTSAESVRGEILDMLDAYGKGLVAGTKKAIAEKPIDAEPVPTTPASVIAKKIRDGEYSV